MFWRALGYLPRLKNPRTFNEKILYRKFYERDNRMPDLMDKVKVKEFVASQLGPEWVIPTLWTGTALPPREERNWPTPYVIKPNHRSGHIIFVRCPHDVDWPSIEQECANWMLQPPHGSALYEWAYGEIRPQIIVEEYIGDETAPPLDFKFYAFDGRVEFLHVDTDRYSNHKRVFYNTKWERQDFSLHFPLEQRSIPKPASFEQMVNAARMLSSGWSFVRVDLYEINGQPKFGELTFYPGSGIERFSPEKWDFVFGELWRYRR